MVTRIADVIQPTVFTNYVVNRTVEKSELIRSGIVTNDPQFNQLASGPNTTINMPFFNDLTGRAEPVRDEGAITPSKIGTGSDIAVKQMWAKAWGANGLSGYLSQTDPMGIIGNLVSDYWRREEQYILVRMLEGVFKSTSMNELTLDTQTALDGSNFVDATQLLGDNKAILTAVMMHSAVEAYLVKRQLIEYVATVNELNMPVNIPYFMGKRVIVDDAMPFDTTTGAASMYLFGQGAIAYGNGSDPNIIQTEFARDALASSGEDFLISRRILLFHPRGIKWTGASHTDVFPNHSELATGANWERVYDKKTVRMVKFNFTIKP